MRNSQTKLEAEWCKDFELQLKRFIFLSFSLKCGTARTNKSETLINDVVVKGLKGVQVVPFKIFYVSNTSVCYYMKHFKPHASYMHREPVNGGQNTWCVLRSLFTSKKVEQLMIKRGLANTNVKRITVVKMCSNKSLHNLYGTIMCTKYGGKGHKGLMKLSRKVSVWKTERKLSQRYTATEGWVIKPPLENVY